MEHNRLMLAVVLAISCLTFAARAAEHQPALSAQPVPDTFSDAGRFAVPILFTTPAEEPAPAPAPDTGSVREPDGAWVVTEKPVEQPPSRCSLCTEADWQALSQRDAALPSWPAEQAARDAQVKPARLHVAAAPTVKKAAAPPPTKPSGMPIWAPF